jgi:hypothetical protein
MRVFVLGLEGSGTRWLRDIIRETLPDRAVSHFSLPRFYEGEGRYIHHTAHFGWPQPEDKFVICVRDIGCAVNSNLPFNDWDWKKACRNAAIAKQAMQEYIADPLFETTIFSYETAMLLQDAYVLPWLSELTGRSYPTWLKQIEYLDGNTKSIKRRKRDE